MKLKLTSIFFVIVFSFVFSNTIFAIDNPKFYFESYSTNMSPDSEFTVSLYLSTPVPVNALDVEFTYMKDELEFLSFNDANSIVNIWQTKPNVNTDGIIRLTGGILKSFTGEKGLILKISFKAKKVGSPQINLRKNIVYLADGSGTEITASNRSIVLSVTEKAKTVELPPEPIDNTPPVVFMEYTPKNRDRQALIVFDAKDAESGIKSTQMRFKKYFIYSEWKAVENPVIYPNGVWKIELKAVNNVNLESIKVSTLKGVIFGRAFYTSLVFLFLVILTRGVYNKYKRTHK